jgi:S-adenosylmethionine uptake transporter
MTISKENEFVMILYFSFIVSVLTTIPAILIWITPSRYEFFMLITIAFLSNIIQYFLFRAFRYSDLSSLAPIRYVEFIFQSVAGFIFFSEIPSNNIILGTLFLIASIFFIMRNKF